MEGFPASALVVSPSRGNDAVSAEPLGREGIEAEVSALMFPAVGAGCAGVGLWHPTNKITVIARADAQRMRTIERLSCRTTNRLLFIRAGFSAD